MSAKDHTNKGNKSSEVKVHIEIGPNFQKAIDNAVDKASVRGQAIKFIVQAFDIKGIVEKSLGSGNNKKDSTK